MGFNSRIEWTTHTFNPWWGCTKVSRGCKFCYAEALSKRYGHDVWGARKPRRLLSDNHWREPLKWEAEARRERLRFQVFCASMADVFEEKAPAGQLDRLWDLIRQTPNLDWQLLTKRPHRIADSLPEDWGSGYQNVWLGTSVEDRRVIDRISLLVKVPAKVHFLSLEPLLGPLPDLPLKGINWVIVGGESGAGARPIYPDWVRSIRNQCLKAEVAFFFKQWGGFNKKKAGRELEGRTWDEMPVKRISVS
ncbi:MAG: phage Gp37/Gp68 family protein [Burkholderiales bacterium]|nr:phage Gp37/Gp68 family protein [Burkholderiales bacterium]